ncbi:MAG: hypothetical protein GEU90_15725 [Gemmatimonas sp.]|nr:hypothetical protein [Gemmatimonas sp.]
MFRPKLLTIISASSVLLPSVAAGQSTDEAVLAQFQDLSESVVRIRTIADLEMERTDQSTGETRTAVRPYSVDGSGVVIGRIEVDGRAEYLILTNHHVADASNYVLEDGGYLRVNPANTLEVPSVPEVSYVIEQPGDSIGERDPALVEMVRRVRGDMTLMRTSGVTRELAVFEGQIGYREGEIEAGAPIVTSGYPWGGEQIIAAGTILETEYKHSLGLPHYDFVVDLPVKPGQSGGPIFLVEGDPSSPEGVRFRLIGLVHAKDGERNFAVRYDAWGESLNEFPADIQARLIR